MHPNSKESHDGKWHCTKSNCNASNSKYQTVCYRCKSPKDWQEQIEREKRRKEQEKAKLEAEAGHEKFVKEELAKPPPLCTKSEDGKHPNNKSAYRYIEFEESWYCGLCQTNSVKPLILTENCQHCWPVTEKKVEYSMTLAASEYHHEEKVCSLCGFKHIVSFKD